METSMVNTACDREEAWLRLVEPTERCFVACLSKILMINNMQVGWKDEHIRVKGIKLLDGGDGYAGEVGDKHLAMVILAHWKLRSLSEKDSISVANA
jgi:hypothetical protein